MNTKRRGPGGQVRKLSIYLFGNTFVRAKKQDVPEQVGFKTEEMSKINSANVSMLDKLTKHWYIDNTARMCTDVPRLVDRVHVKSGAGIDLWTRTQSEDNVAQHGMVIDLMKSMLEILEDDDIAKDIMAKLDACALEQEELNEPSDAYLGKLLETCGRTSRVYRIMKCLHQDYVLIGTTDFKLNFLKTHMMKDVREEDGWQVRITIADYIQIVHVRKEQSIDMPGQEKNHFDITYDISMTFDRNMDEMTAAQLKISELTTHPNMDEKFKEEIVSLFGNGNLIVE